MQGPPLLGTAATVVRMPRTPSRRDKAQGGSRLPRDGHCQFQRDPSKIAHSSVANGSLLLFLRLVGLSKRQKQCNVTKSTVQQRP